MYNALTEDLMFQETRDRAARMTPPPRKDMSVRRNRWWRKVSHRAR
jgi:hypothetical protein